MQVRQKINCLLVCNEDKSFVHDALKVIESDNKGFFKINLDNENICLSVKVLSTQARYVALFDEAIRNTKIMIYGPTPVDTLHEKIESAEKTGDLAVFRVAEQELSDINLSHFLTKVMAADYFDNRKAEIQQAKLAADMTQRLYDEALLDLIMSIVEDTSYWRERYSPSLIKNLKIIIKDDELSAAQKWQQIILAANKPATAETALGFMSRSRHQDTISFCDAVLNANPRDALTLFAQRMKTVADAEILNFQNDL